jgi:hypothetical protein
MQRGSDGLDSIADIAPRAIGGEDRPPWKDLPVITF